MQNKKGLFSNPYTNHKHSHILGNSRNSKNSRNYNSRESINKNKIRQTSPIPYTSNSSNHLNQMSKKCNKQNVMSQANKPADNITKGQRKSKQVFKNKEYNMQSHFVMQQDWIDGDWNGNQKRGNTEINYGKFQLFKSLVQLQDNSKISVQDKFSVFTRGKNESAKEPSNRISMQRRISHEQSFNNTCNDSFLSRIEVLEPQSSNTKCKTHKRIQSSNQRNSQSRRTVIVTPNKKFSAKKSIQKDQTNQKIASLHKHRRTVSYKSPYSQKSNQKSKIRGNLVQDKPMIKQEIGIQKIHNQKNFIETQYEGKLLQKLQQSNKALTERNQTLIQSQKQYQQSILQYQQYVREISQQLIKSKKYEQGIKHTVMWMLQLYCYYGQRFKNSHVGDIKHQKLDFQQYFMKVFKTYNQYLEQLDIENKLKQISSIEKDRRQVCNVIPISRISGKQSQRNDSLDNSFEDTFNFAFRKAYKIKSHEQSNVNSKLQQVDINNISKRLFGNSCQKQRHFCQSDNLKSSRHDILKQSINYGNSNSNMKSQRVSQLEYSVTDQQNFEKQVNFSQLQSKVTVISNLHDYQIQNDVKQQQETQSVDQTGQISKIEAEVIQQYDQQEQNYISPLHKGQIVTLVRRIDDQLWIAQTLEKIGYVKNSILKII